MTKKIISTPLQFAQLSAGEDGEQWKISGYATVFDNKNCYGFKIAQGAYAELIKKGVQPPIFFNHQSYSVPIGKWTTLKEDKVGLYVEGFLTKGVSTASDVYHAVQAGTIDGLSVGIGWKSQDTEEHEDGTFSIRKISSLYEISVVTYPADGKARVLQCLSADEIDEQIEKVETLRDLEAFIRETSQLSKRQSGWLMSKAKAVIASDTSRDDLLKAREKELTAMFSRIESGISNL